MIPQGIISDILSKIDLHDIVGETVDLCHRGGSYEGLCPFHAENTPSFKVFADHFHCFGCGAHGNALEFVMKTNGLSFPEAVKALASRTGLSLSAPLSQVSATSSTMELAALRHACARFHQALLDERGKIAMDALASRNIEMDAIVRFGLGFAPDEWGFLSDDRKIKRDILVSAGLAVRRKGEKKGCYDFFRNRLIFPVRNDSGDVIGFGGRRLDNEGPKYLNSPETALYQKGSVLFGFVQARQAIRLTRSVIVCEGFFDVVTPFQAGIEHIVSTCGTALTNAQAELVLSSADKVYFCFDGDAAGAKATWRAAVLLVPLVSDHHEIRLCRLPAGEDPDSLVRKDGPEALTSALEAAPTLSAYLVGEVTRGSRIPEARARSLAMAITLWRRFSAPGMAVFFRQYACEALQLSSEEFTRLAGSAALCGASALRPCPCCGSSADCIPAEDGFRVQCLECGIATPLFSSQDEVHAIWNRRERPRLKQLQSIK